MRSKSLREIKWGEENKMKCEIIKNNRGIVFYYRPPPFPPVSQGSPFGRKQRRGVKKKRFIFSGIKILIDNLSVRFYMKMRLISDLEEWKHTRRIIKYWTRGERNKKKKRIGKIVRTHGDVLPIVIVLLSGVFTVI